MAIAADMPVQYGSSATMLIEEASLQSRPCMREAQHAQLQVFKVFSMLSSAAGVCTVLIAGKASQARCTPRPVASVYSGGWCSHCRTHPRGTFSPNHAVLPCGVRVHGRVCGI